MVRSVKALSHVRTLYSAIEKNNIKLATNLIKKLGQNVTVLDYHVIAAVKHSTNKMLHMLLNAGGNPNAISNDLSFYPNETLLCLAVIHKDIEMMKMLIEAGGSVDKLGSNDETPLFKALRTNYTPAIDILISANASLDMKLHSNVTNHLLASIGRGEIEGLQMLLKAGIDVNQINVHGRTALRTILSLMYSIPEQNLGNIVKIAKMLIEYGARVDLTDNKGHTPLFNACNSFIDTAGINKQVITDYIQCLLTAGADPNKKCCYMQDTPLIALMRWPEGATLPIVKMLIEAGANVNIQNRVGDTALAVASRTSDNYKNIRSLTVNAVDIDVNLTNNLELSALDHLLNHSLTNENRDSIKCLIYAGAKVTNEGLTRLDSSLTTARKQYVENQIKLSSQCRELIRTVLIKLHHSRHNKCVRYNHRTVMQLVKQLGLPLLLTSYLSMSPIQAWVEMGLIH